MCLVKKVAMYLALSDEHTELEQLCQLRRLLLSARALDRCAATSCNVLNGKRKQKSTK